MSSTNDPRSPTSTTEAVGFPRPGLRLLCELDVEVAQPISIGPAPAGEVRLLPILGGRVHGPELEGKILPGGADWQSVRSDGQLEVRARYLLETDRGERIEVKSEGVRAAPAEVLARLARSELVDPNDYYFRTAIRFGTAAERLLRLNDLLACSYGARNARGVALTVYEIL